MYKLPPDYELHIHRQRIPLATKWYTFSLPKLIVAGLLTYWALDNIQERNDRANSQACYEKVVNALDSSVQKLTTKHFLKLRDVSGNFAERYIYMKIESIKGGSVTGAFINTGKSTYEESAMNVEQFYNKYKDRLNQFSFSKQQLTASITRRDYPSLYLSATNYKYNTPYTFVMELTDTSGTKHEYLVEGVNLQKKITKKKSL